jgi:NF-X1-type zinc finger protein NFXL1
MVGVGVMVGDGVIGVFVIVGVNDGVMDGVNDGVKEEVSVKVGVNVGNKVEVIVLVGVTVGVGVKVGVFVEVPVRTNGVRLRVGESGVVVNVNVEVALGVRSEALGARVMAIQPMQ